MIASTWPRRALGGVLLAAALAAPAGADETTVSAFSAWDARGELYQTGPEEATFVGVLSGVLIVEGADGSFEAGRMTCPARLQVGLADWSQTGSGDCVLVTPDGERIYGGFRCSGQYRDGCTGEFTLTGGTGSREGIEGGGPIEFRNALPDWTAVPGNVFTAEAVGLVKLPALTFRLP